MVKINISSLWIHSVSREGQLLGPVFLAGGPRGAHVAMATHRSVTQDASPVAGQSWGTTALPHRPPL